MKRYTSDKDIRKVVRNLISRGWGLKAGKKHCCIISPTGRKVTIPSTPSDHRAIYNFRSDVRKIEVNGLINV